MLLVISQSTFEETWGSEEAFEETSRLETKTGLQNHTTTCTQIAGLIAKEWFK